MKNRESLEKIYNLLEKQEKTMFFEYHKDVESREKIIKDAMNKISLLKIIGEDLNDIVLLGDFVALEVTYSPTEVEMLTQKLVLNSEKIGELSLFSAIGAVIFGEKVGDIVPAKLPTGAVANVRILAKNKDIFEEKEEVSTLSK